MVEIFHHELLDGRFTPQARESAEWDLRIIHSTDRETHRILRENSNR